MTNRPRNVVALAIRGVKPENAALERRCKSICERPHRRRKISATVASVDRGSRQSTRLRLGLRGHEIQRIVHLSRGARAGRESDARKTLIEALLQPVLRLPSRRRLAVLRHFEIELDRVELCGRRVFGTTTKVFEMCGHAAAYLRRFATPVDLQSGVKHAQLLGRCVVRRCNFEALADLARPALATKAAFAVVCTIH